MSFLTAEWRKLAIANFETDPEVLKPYLPAHTELDLWNGTCYVSLIGFMFLKTKLLGIPVPFHRNFEEVNIRFYVKHYDGEKWKRGVVFVKEIVPKPAITLVANLLYHERYATMKMKHEWHQTDAGRSVKYFWQKKRSRNNFFVTAALHSEPIPVGSETEFITEHYWGYSSPGPGKTVEYEVTHPRWEHYPVLGYKIDVDFAGIYGPEFDFLRTATPLSVMLAEGSAITIEGKKKLGQKK